MDIFVVSMLLAFAVYTLRSRSEKRRIALLAQHLGQFEIEKLMVQLTEGYARALGEDDVQRRAAIWDLQGGAEDRLCAQLQQLATGFAQVPAERTRMHRLPWPLSEVAGRLPLLAASHFDLREMLKIHAAGMARACARSDAASPRARAFTVSAEMLLMQHSCHWFCKSRAIATARMLVRQQTPYALLLASVTPQTRRAYSALVGAPAAPA